MSDIATHPAYTCGRGIAKILHTLGRIDGDEKIIVYIEPGTNLLHLDETCADERDYQTFHRTIAEQAASTERTCLDCDTSGSVTYTAEFADVLVAERLTLWKAVCDLASEQAGTVPSIVPSTLLPPLQHHLVDISDSDSDIAPIANEIFRYDLDRLTAEGPFRTAQRRHLLSLWAGAYSRADDIPDRVSSDPRLDSLPDLVPCNISEMRNAVVHGTDDDVNACYDKVAGPLVWVRSANWNVATAITNPTEACWYTNLIQVPATAVWTDMRQFAQHGALNSGLIYLPDADVTPDDMHAAVRLAGDDDDKIPDYARGLVAART